MLFPIFLGTRALNLSFVIPFWGDTHRERPLTVKNNNASAMVPCLKDGGHGREWWRPGGTGRHYPSLEIRLLWYLFSGILQGRIFDISQFLMLGQFGFVCKLCADLLVGCGAGPQTVTRAVECGRKIGCLDELTNSC